MMADTIEVVTTVELVAWPVPDFVCIGSGDVSEDEGASGEHLHPIESAPQASVDALAQRFLENLYARRCEPSPFRLTSREK